MGTFADFIEELVFGDCTSGKEPDPYEGWDIGVDADPPQSQDSEE